MGGLGLGFPPDKPLTRIKKGELTAMETLFIFTMGVAWGVIIYWIIF